MFAISQRDSAQFTDEIQMAYLCENVMVLNDVQAPVVNVSLDETIDLICE